VALLVAIERVFDYSVPMTPGNRTAEPTARSALFEWLATCGDLLDVLNGGLEHFDSHQVAEFIRALDQMRSEVPLLERNIETESPRPDRPTARILATIVRMQTDVLDHALRLATEESSRRVRPAARPGRRSSGDPRVDWQGQGFSPPRSAQPRTAAARASALFVRSQVKSGSSRPK
jgi:hypothetical protein